MGHPAARRTLALIARAALWRTTALRRIHTLGQPGAHDSFGDQALVRAYGHPGRALVAQGGPPTSPELTTPFVAERSRRPLGSLAPNLTKSRDTWLSVLAAGLLVASASEDARPIDPLAGPVRPAAECSARLHWPIVPRLARRRRCCPWRA